MLEDLPARPAYGPGLSAMPAVRGVLALDDAAAACLAALPWRVHPAWRFGTDPEDRPDFDGNGPRCTLWDEAFVLFVSVGRLDAAPCFPLHRRLIGSAPGGQPLHLAIVLPPGEPLPAGTLIGALSEVAETADFVLLLDPAALPADRSLRRDAEPLAQITADGLYGALAPIDIAGKVFFGWSDWVLDWKTSRFWGASSAFGPDEADRERLPSAVVDGLSLLLDGRPARGATSTALWDEASLWDLDQLADGFRGRLSIGPDEWPGRPDVHVPGLRGLGLVGFAGLGDDPEPVANVLARLGWERA